jgi:hypothetical protein
LKAAGVRILFDRENPDTDEVYSNLIISVMESLAQFENERMPSADHNSELVEGCSSRKEKAKQFLFRW